MTVINQTICLPEHISDIFQTMKKINLPVWLVGGCLRDILLGKIPNDWDFATPLPPTEVKTRLEKQGFTVIETGIAHGTLTFIFNQKTYEITTFRQEGPYKDYRHPDWVHFTSDISQDLARRDFTINAMAYEPDQGLWDPFGGLQDILNKQIRCVGDPQQRFKEDALRILRGVRFVAQTGFALDKAAAKAIKENSHLLKNISVERIREEFNKLLLAPWLSQAVSYLEKLNLWPYLVPDIIPCIGFNQHSSHHYLDVYHHIMVTVYNTPPDLVLRLAALFHDIGKPATFKLDEKGKGHFYGHSEVGALIAKNNMKRLRYANNIQKQVIFLIKHHMLHLSDLSDKTLKLFISQMPEPKKEYLDKLLTLQEADLLASANKDASLQEHQQFKERCYRILNSGDPLTLQDLAINGHDLIQLGIEPKERGPLLHKLLYQVLDNPEMNKKELLLKYIKESQMSRSDTGKTNERN